MLYSSTLVLVSAPSAYTVTRLYGPVLRKALEITIPNGNLDIRIMNNVNKLITCASDLEMLLKAFYMAAKKEMCILGNRNTVKVRVFVEKSQFTQRLHTPLSTQLDGKWEVVCVGKNESFLVADFRFEQSGISAPFNLPTLFLNMGEDSTPRASTSGATTPTIDEVPEDDNELPEEEYSEVFSSGGSSVGSPASPQSLLSRRTSNTSFSHPNVAVIGPFQNNDDFTKILTTVAGFMATSKLIIGSTAVVTSSAVSRPVHAFTKPPTKLSKSAITSFIRFIYPDLQISVTSQTNRDKYLDEASKKSSLINKIPHMLLTVLLSPDLDALVVSGMQGQLAAKVNAEREALGRPPLSVYKLGSTPERKTLPRIRPMHWRSMHSVMV